MWARGSSQDWVGDDGTLYTMNALNPAGSGSSNWRRQDHSVFVATGRRPASGRRQSHCSVVVCAERPGYTN
jgi:hypothetical protein